MPTHLLPWFEWAQSSWLGHAVHTSLWLFPVLESTHLLALSLLGGVLLVVDLRMLGIVLRDQPIATLARGVQPWLVRSLFLMAGTGVLLLISEAVKCYHIPSFWVKVTALPFALAFTFLVRNPLALNDATVTGWRSRAVAAASIGLWFTVAMAGRWIGFSS
ncbi:MAG: DUF6644 family protein [Gemmatimonadota bacterium]